MAAPADGTEPISDDEILYRRIPVGSEWFDPEVDPRPSPKAFRPRPDDTTGLSLYRRKYKSPQQVAANPRGARYYVAELHAGDMRAKGITVIPGPLPGDPGHAAISDLTYENRKTSRAMEIQKTLAEELCLGVHGPFSMP